MVAAAIGVAAGVAASSIGMTVGVAVLYGITAAAIVYGVKVAKEFQEGTAASDRKQMVRASNGPMVGILGKSEISGTIFFAEEVKDDNQLHLCLALCGHVLPEGEPVIRKCRRVMMDDIEVPLGESNDGRVYVHVYDGSQQTIDDIEDRLKNCYSWQDDMIGKGICFAHLHLKFDEDLFPSGLPNFKFLLDTEGDTDDPDNPQPIEMTSAKAMEYYLRYVFEAQDREVNQAMFDQALALCSESVINTEGMSELRYTCNGCWDYSETHKSVIDKIIQTCAGSLEYVDGQFGLRGGGYNGPADFNLTTDDIIGDISVQPIPEHQNLANVITGTHVSPLYEYQTVDFPEVRSLELIEIDGEELNEDFNLEFVHSTYQAQRLASIHLNRSRLSTVSLHTNLRGYECGLSRHIRLLADELGYDNVEFMVEGWEFAHDDGVSLTLRQDYPELWDDYIGKTPTPPPRTILPNPRECLAPEKLLYSERQVNNVWESRLDWRHPAPGGITEYRITLYKGSNINPDSVVAEYISREPRCIFELPEPDQHFATVVAVNTFGVSSPPAEVAFWVDIPSVEVTTIDVETVDNSVFPCRAYVIWQTQGDDQYPSESVRYECETRQVTGNWLPVGSGISKSRWLEGLQPGNHEVRVRAVTPMNTESFWQVQPFTVVVAEQPQNLQFEPLSQDSYWGRAVWEGEGIRWEIELSEDSSVLFATTVTRRELYLEWQPPGSYLLKVRAVAGASQSDWATTSADVAPLQPPDYLTFTAQNGNPSSSGELTWVAGDSRTEFHEIELLKDDDRQFTATDSGSFQALPVLIPGQYTGRVRGVWRQSVSGWATTAINIIDSVEIPTALEIVLPSDASYQGTFRWSGTAASYGVRILENSDTLIETSVLGNQYRMPLLPVAEYRSEVRSQGNWSDSGWAGIPLIVNPPEAPSALTFTETPDNAASYGTLSWQASPSAGVSGYLVSISEADSGNSVIVTQTVTTHYPVGNLPANNYDAKVSALSLQGSSESEPASEAFTVSALLAPINLGYQESLVETGTGLTTRVVFRWEAGDSRTQNYDVEYRALDNPIWSGLYSGPSATATINGLSAGDYWFRVRALSYADSSGWSQLGANVLGFNQPPQNIENLQLRALGGQQALLTWDQIQSPDVINGGSVHVRHTYLTGSAAVWEASVPLTERLPGNTTFFSVPLLSGTYFVKAVNGSGFWSEQAASVVSTMGNMVGYNRVVEREEPKDWPGEKFKAVVDQGGSISMSMELDNLTGEIDWSSMTSSSHGDIIDTGEKSQSGEKIYQWTAPRRDAYTNIKKLIRPIAVGQTYRYSVWAKSVTDSAQIELYRFDKSSSWSYAKPKAFNLTKNWKYCSFERTLGDDNESEDFAYWRMDNNIDGDTIQFYGLKIENLEELNFTPFYVMDEPLDLGAIFTVRLYLECDGSVYEVDTIDERTNTIDTWPMFDGVEPGGTSLQYHVSQTDDDPASSSAIWSDWTQFLVGEFRARAFRLRVSLITDSTGAAGTVSNLRLIADVPDRSESRRNVSVSSSGLRVNYATPFLAPAVIGITLHSANTGDYWRITNSNEQGFTIRFYSSSGAKAASFDFLATSYGEQ